MVLGFADGSMVIFAVKYTCPPIVVLVSVPLQTRFISLRIESGIGWPSAEPDTIDHSPCKRARSFLTASSSAAEDQMLAAAASPRNKMVRISLIPRWMVKFYE